MMPLIFWCSISPLYWTERALEAAVIGPLQTNYLVGVLLYDFKLSFLSNLKVTHGLITHHNERVRIQEELREVIVISPIPSAPAPIYPNITIQETDQVEIPTSFNTFVKFIIIKNYLIRLI